MLLQTVHSAAAPVLNLHMWSSNILTNEDPDVALAKPAFIIPGHKTTILAAESNFYKQTGKQKMDSC